MDEGEKDKIIEQLRTQLKDSDNKLKLSAGYGKQLLEANEKLNNKLSLCNSKIDTLSQENYNLRSEISSHLNTAQYLRGELEALTEQWNKKVRLDEGETDKVVLAHRQQVQDYEREINELKAELNSKCEAMNALEKHTDMLKLELQESGSPKVTELEQLLQELQEMNQKTTEDKKRLEEDSQMRDLLIEEYKDSISGYEQQIEDLKRQLEEKELKFAAVYESLKFARSEVSELQGELQLIRSNIEPSDLDKRGNSLFSEVDDRRMKMEAVVAQLKKNCEILKNEKREKQEKMQKLEIKMSSLHLASSRKVSANVVEQLEMELSKAHVDIQLLLSSLNKYKECDSPAGLTSVNAKAQDTECRHLKMLLHQSKSRVIELEKEVRGMWTERVSGREQRREYRRKIIELEQEIDLQKSENIKMKTRVEQLECDRKENQTSELVHSGSNQLKSAAVSAETVSKPRVKKSVPTSGNVLKSKRVVNECQQQ